MKNKINNFYIIVMLLLGSLAVLVYILNGNLLVLTGFFIFFYAVSIIKAIYFFGSLSIYSIYLYTSFFFVYSRLFFDIIGYRSFLVIGFPKEYSFSERTGSIFIISSFVSFFVIDIIYSSKSSPGGVYANNLIKLPSLRNAGIALMCIAFPALLYKLYLQLLFVKANGYLSIYNGELDKLALPAWSRGTGTLFVIGYMLFLASYPPHGYFLIVSAVYLFNALFGSLKGTRSGFLIELIAVIYFYTKFYNKKIKIGRMFFLFGGIILFSVILGYSRANMKFSASAGDVLKGFFYGQGNTIGVPLYLMEAGNRIKYKRFPFIFTSVLEPAFNIIYKDSPTRQIKLEKYSSLPVIATHAISPSMYYAGNGLGGSVLAEMYDFGGIIGVIIWSSLLAVLMLQLEKSMFRKNLYIPFCFFFMSTLIYLPRYHFFGFVEKLHHLILFWLLLALLVFLSYPKKIIRRSYSKIN